MTDLFVLDTRPDGHSSLGTLPRLGTGDIDALQNFYKFGIDDTYGAAFALPGQLYWRLAGFELNAGPAVLQPQVCGENGQKLIGPEHNVALFLHWPGVDPLPQGFEPRYEETALVGFTDGSGDVGWGFGPESHIGDEGGPFCVWTSADPPNWSDRRVGSDAVTKLGWWDDHIIPNPIFQVTRQPGSTPLPTGTEYLVNVAADGSIMGHIAFVPGVPEIGNAALGLMRDGRIVAYIKWG